MAASIESRVPFLDHTLVEFAARIPDNLKIRGRTQKYILKAAVSDLLPRGIIHRKKMGFPPPLSGWLRDRGRRAAASACAPRRTAGGSSRSGRQVDALIERHRSEQEDATDRIWRLINLQIWGDLFLTGRREQVLDGGGGAGMRGGGMKILWVKSDFLHPTQGGGQIRTLETLKRLHRRHEIHFAALDLPQPGIGPSRSSEYCTKAYPVAHTVAAKEWTALLEGAGHRPCDGYPSGHAALPVACVVTPSGDANAGGGNSTRSCAIFSLPRPTFQNWTETVLFQHNVESMIWKRHMEHAPSPWHRAYCRGAI